MKKTMLMGIITCILLCFLLASCDSGASTQSKTTTGSAATTAPTTAAATAAQTTAGGAPVQFVWDDGAIAALAFFDYSSYESLDEDFENWPVIYDAFAQECSIFADIPISDVEALVLPGYEVYCIIPRYENNRIIVEALEMISDDQGDSYLDAVGTPFDGQAKALVINCNESDLYSNVRITILTEGGETSFNPYISLNDGSIVAGEGIQIVYPDWEYDY